MVEGVLVAVGWVEDSAGVELDGVGVDGDWEDTVLVDGGGHVVLAADHSVVAGLVVGPGVLDGACLLDALVWVEVVGDGSGLLEVSLDEGEVTAVASVVGGVAVDEALLGELEPGVSGDDTGGLETGS